MQQVKIGYSSDPATEMGPVAMKRQLERIERYVDLGVREGAQLVTGGRRPPQLKKGYFFEPTLFANVGNRMTIAREEIFGPVLSLIPARDLDHAVELAQRVGLRVELGGADQRRGGGVSRWAPPAGGERGAQRDEGGLQPAVWRVQAVRRGA